jgi:hypothetical protein
MIWSDEYQEFWALPDTETDLRTRGRIRAYSPSGRTAMESDAHMEGFVSSGRRSPSHVGHG